VFSKTTVALLIALCLIFGAVQSWAGVDYGAPGPAAVEVLKYDWQDEARNRAVPVKIYYPGKSDSRPGPYPVILFSHGLGGSRDGYEFLGRHWAGYGYVSVYVQHLGSDAAVWKNQTRPLKALRDAVADLQNSIDRPNDIKFAISRLDRLNQEPGPLQGLLDMDRLGAAGHSFGAFTTLALAGQVFTGPQGRTFTFTEPRLKAVIAMSAPVGAARNQPDQAFGPIQIPCLHLTGTKDESFINDTKASDRRLPYDHIHRADQYLVIFTNGDHMIFSGRERLFGGAAQDQAFHRLILAATTAFWEAYLKSDLQAKSWLAKGGLAQTLDGHGTLEDRIVSK
jgi:predicted dienelactone hydrolase